LTGRRGLGNEAMNHVEVLKRKRSEGIGARGKGGFFHCGDFVPKEGEKRPRADNSTDAVVKKQVGKGMR